MPLYTVPTSPVAAVPALSRSIVESRERSDATAVSTAVFFLNKNLPLRGRLHGAGAAACVFHLCKFHRWVKYILYSIKTIRFVCYTNKNTQLLLSNYKVVISNRDFVSFLYDLVASV